MKGLTARLMPTAPMQISLKNRMARLHMSTTAHVVRAKARGDAQYAMARDEPYRVGGRYQRVVPCSFCGASGQCKYCGGKGESVMVNYYDSKTQSMDGYDVNTGKKNRSVHGENSGENYYGPSNSNKSTCHNCHGTGVDPFPWKDHTAGQGLRWCYTNSEGAKCPYCSERAWHQHHRCASCNP